MTDAFAIDTVSIHTQSSAVRQRNYQKVYALDWALAEAVSTTAGRGSSRTLENLVYVELKRRGWPVYYLTTRTGGEIDFVVVTARESLHLMQVCQELTDQNFAREISSLAAAARYTGAASAVVVTLWEEREIVCDDVRIQVIPAWKWLLESGDNA